MKQSISVFALVILGLVTTACNSGVSRAAPAEFQTTHATDASDSVTQARLLHALSETSFSILPTPTPALPSSGVIENDEDPSNVASDTDADDDDSTLDLEKLLNAAEATATPEGLRILKTGRNMIKIGTIVEGSCWDYINAVYKKAGATEANTHTAFSSKQAGPYAELPLIQGGDWLYYINHSYGDVEHSGIFITWVDFDKKIGLILSYRGENSEVPGRYSTYDLSSVYSIQRPKEGLDTRLGPLAF